MTFLVLIQGYALVVSPLVTIGQGAAVAVVVGAATAGSAYLIEHRIAVWAARRAIARRHNEGDGKSKS